MKRTVYGFALIVVLATLLVGNALALEPEFYTLPQIREQAAQGWHETYTDKYGRTIPVDVEIEVFGADTAPVLKTTIGYKALDPSLLPEGATLDNAPDDRTLILLNNPSDAVFITRKGEQPLTLYRSYGKKIDMNAKYMEEYGTALTMQDMVDHLGGLLDKQGIDTSVYLFDQPMDFSVRCKVKKDSMEVVESPIYLAHFWQRMHGLPILTHADSSFVKSTWPSYLPQLVLGMREKDEFQITINGMEEVEMLANDIPLCSFDQVKSHVVSMIESGNIQKIFSVRFGYAVFNDSDFPSGKRSAYDAACYYLVPSWVVECAFMENPKNNYAPAPKRDDELEADEQTSRGYKTLVFNAQTGAVLDPFDRSKHGGGNADYQGFLSWQEVQR